MIRYFAYGYNTNTAEMTQRIPPAIFIGKALLPNYKFVMNNFADVVPFKGGEVYGVLWDIPVGWVSELDALEELYEQHTVQVKWENSRTRAMIYRMTQKHPGPPSQDYVDYVKMGYVENNLPLKQLTDAV